MSLLRRHPVGRVAIVRHGQPEIVPVTYVVLGEDVVFASTTGGKSIAAAERAALAFEVDEIDPLTHTGWSVVVTGVAHETDASEATDGDSLGAGLGLHSWVGRHAVHLFRLSTARISGRRIAPPTQETTPAAD